MIIDALLNVVSSLGLELSSQFHLPIITELPWGMDATLTNAVGGYKAMAVFFPPLSIIMTAFLIYLGFRITIIVLRVVPFLREAIKDN